MLTQIDPTSDRPAYRQIADQLRGAMLEGRLVAGAQLPSERVLSELCGSSRVTVRQAIALLRAEGLIDVQHGRGAFVRDRPPLRRLGRQRLTRSERTAGRGAFLTDTQHRQPQVEVEVVTDIPPSWVAERLRTPQDHEVLMRKRRMYADDIPVQLATSYIPLDIAQGTRIEQPNTGPGGLYARLEEAGHRLARFEEVVSARMPLPEEIRALRLASGVPLIRVVRTAFDHNGRAVEVNDILIAADRYELIYEFPAT